MPSSSPSPAAAQTHATDRVREVGDPRFSGERVALALVPGALAVLLYALNNIGVIHAALSAPPGYVPFGLPRDADVAQYLTWIAGLEKGWLLPNYHAAWTTGRGLFVPGLYPVLALKHLFSLSTIAAFHIFNLAAYVCTAYALAFAYRTFCESRRDALWAFLISAACVPLAALPALGPLLRAMPLGSAVFGTSGGVAEFSLISDGFLHGLTTWPLITWGTCLQMLGMSLLARYHNSQKRRWLRWLGVICFVLALIHPFEIFVLAPVAAIMFISEGGPISRILERLSFVALPAVVGFLPYIIGSQRFDWVHQVSLANCSLPVVLPSRVLAAIGLPAVLALVFLFFGYPRNTGGRSTVLKAWFIATFIVLYVPGVPFPLHVLDGLFLCIGMLLVAQIKELIAGHIFFSRPAGYVLAVVAVTWMLYPQIILRADAWRDSVDVKSVAAHRFPAAVAPADEPKLIEWLRKNGSPDDLVLANENEAPWMSTVPTHSFDSHWLFSSEETRPGDPLWQQSFFNGTLNPQIAQRFLEVLGTRFVVVPDGSRAASYMSSAIPRVHFGTSTIYEIPGAHMRPYLDPGIVALGAGTLR